jgi:hypothetical protein
MYSTLWYRQANSVLVYFLPLPFSFTSNTPCAPHLLKLRGTEPGGRQIKNNSMYFLHYFFLSYMSINALLERLLIFDPSQLHISINAQSFSREKKSIVIVI